MRAPRLIGVAVCALLAASALWSGADTAPQESRETVRSFLRVAPAAATAGAAGLTPADIASAYGLTSGTAGTVAVVTAYSVPTLESDLAVYRSTFGLPACGTVDGCLRIVGQRGTATLPRADADWGQETSLDVDAVSAACPDCRILVVQADGASIGQLGAAVDTAVRLGADAVSASWGDTEWRSWSGTAAHFSHPGVPVVAATGDDGQAAAVFPAALPDVIAVGGTTLTSTAGGASPLTVQQVDGGSVTTATTSSAVAKDRIALARAKASLKAAKHRVAVAKARLHRAEVRRARAATAHDRAHWRHRVRDLSRSLSTARASVSASSKRVSSAEATLLRDVLRDASAKAAARARAGQGDRTGWIETAWRGAGSGCSSVVPRPSWQPATTCAHRATADVAADADPETGIATYDTFGTVADSADGWMVAGGTSLAAPLVAAMLVRSGHAAGYSSAEPLYERAGAFWDVTGGSNGSCGTALCDAGVGYDGPTGVGSPRSLASF
ncbi:S53 family peptidase [Amnibacterium kyonggiense]|uniref:Subtilase family protein n=1 Tax=Amnibacterium kyonggiense TaxID=595671 RepID=A0A4R7FPL5_9MICO|nr:S8 family serine peptidase [Amnibacterium kyonggiense]TDS79695.1 subtilase family protein [Amnibacterium kyonggiense]